MSSHSVLLQAWEGPHGGVPPFDRVEARHLAPAVDQGMAELLAEVDAIAQRAEPPTFANTIEALEGTGRAYDRVTTLFYVHTSTMATDEIRAIEAELAPKMAGLWDAISQNTALFARIEGVRAGREFADLTAEQQRLTKKVHDDFVRSGARLDPASKERLAAVNRELASCYTRFRQNLLRDEETWIALEGEPDLAGLPASWIASAAAAAAERGVSGWVVVNTRSSAQPFLTFSDRRDLRERVWRAWVGRGDNGGDTDNNALITRILALRAERAGLLGYETHAHWRLEDTMAREPGRAMALMLSLWEPAVGRIADEVAAQQALASALGHDVDIAPWDCRYYQEKVRKERYDVDETEIEPYMQLEKLREAMFHVATELHGLRFEQAEGVPVAHPDVRVWAIEGATGDHVGLFYFDPYARPGKQSGAWMNAYRKQERYAGRVTPIVSNNCNFSKGAPGEPVLLSWDDAETLFHEFGHALHGLLSDVSYPTLAGTSVARDFVELPSQLNERWLRTSEVLQRFALHVETGEPIPRELVARIEAARNADAGFATVEFLASALVDMKLHLAGDTPIDPAAFESSTLGELGMPDTLVMRHRAPHFAHIFGGDGYSAGYYSYLWADTLVADAAEAFAEAGSMYDAATATRLREQVLSVGNTVDPADAFRAFRGRDVDVGALLRERGFAG